MVTFFSSPRPFKEAHTIIIQHNAIRSWLSLRPQPQILLMGDDEGVSEVAKEYSIDHVPDVELDQNKIPMRSSMCAIARQVAEYDMLCIINSDIIILDNFVRGLEAIDLDRFVAAGRRYDLTVEREIEFANPSWRTLLSEDIAQNGALHGPSAIDYVVYPKDMMPMILPPFPMNMPGWDPWFLYEHKRNGIPVVDLSQLVRVVHQNHETKRENAAKQRRWRTDSQSMRKLSSIGGFENMMTLREADYIVSRLGMRRPGSVGRILSALATTTPYRKVLGLKRRLQRFLAYVQGLKDRRGFWG